MSGMRLITNLLVFPVGAAFSSQSQIPIDDHTPFQGRLHNMGYNMVLWVIVQ